ncbi:MAG: hypothetical protein RI911_753 [Candidatus Parcubacteria bacterium]|jgi:ABC-type transport system involved in cytochrome bd biosynthesis fused ATPase/permease subunit
MREYMQSNGIPPVSSGYDILSAKEMGMSFRLLLDELHSKIQGDPEIAAQIKSFKELLSPELFSEYQAIFVSLSQCTKKTRDSHERRYIDLDAHTDAAQIHVWVERLVTHVTETSRLTHEEQESLRGEAHIFFYAVADSLNARSLSLDVREFMRQSKFEKQGEFRKKQTIEDISSVLSAKYRVPREEMRQIVLTQEKITIQGELSVSDVLEVMTYVWKTFEVGKDKRGISKIAAGTIMQQLGKSAAPLQLQGIEITKTDFAMLPLVLFALLDKGSDVLGAWVSSMEEDFKYDVKQRINDLLYNAYFYKDLSELDDVSLGELNRIFDDSRKAALGLVDKVVTELGPLAAGTAFSLSFLIMLHPALAGASIAMMPVVLTIAKRAAKQRLVLLDDMNRAREIADTSLATVQQGLETVRASANVQEALSDTQGIQRMVDELQRKNEKSWIRFGIVQHIVQQTAFGISILSGYLMHKVGLVSPGAIASNAIYAGMLQYRMNQFVHLWFQRLPKDIADIKKMQEFLIDDAQGPESAAEKERIPTTKLQDAGVTLDALSYKGVLRNVSLTIKSGEFVVLTGPSGEGKTTILRHIQGTRKPDVGSVLIGGVESSEIKKYGADGMQTFLVSCTQSPHIFDGKSLFQNVVLWNPNPPSEDDVVRVLEQVGLGKFKSLLTQEVKYMSGGEKVRLGLARGLLRLQGRTEGIVLLDEPTASLDPETASDIRSLLKKLHDTNPGLTIICVTHDEKLVEVGDREVSMRNLT